MQWRQVGPFRGGRALAIEGVRDEPNTWYFDAENAEAKDTITPGVNEGLHETAGFRKAFGPAVPC
jgi:hypothetical protein